MHKFLISILALLVSANPPAMAQGSAPSPRSATPRKLGIFTLEGEGAVNSIPAQVVTVPVVEIRDENDKPLEGATVIFSLPLKGAGGSFPGGELTLTKRTDPRGQAAAAGFTLNSTAGPFLIRVTAQFNNLTATAFIRQSNSDKLPNLGAAKSGSKWKWVVLGIAAGAGAGAGVYFGRKSTSGPSPISISPGTVVFGSPR